MAHIHTDPGQHDLTVSAFIIRTDLGEPAVLLHRHRILNKWLQFGGHVELNENPWQAIAHELAEESGYELKTLKLLQPPGSQLHLEKTVSHPLPAQLSTHPFGDLDHRHIDIAYAFVADQPPQHEVGEGESQTLQAFTAKQLTALGEDEVAPGVCEISLHILEEYLPNWQQVPTTEWR